MCKIHMDLIATEVTMQDPVVVVIDIGWMKRLIENDFGRHTLVTIIDLLFSSGLYDQKKITYLETENGHTADEDVILEWESNLQKIIGDRETWVWIKNNVPDNVFNGFDMGVGGDEHGANLLDMVNGLPKNIDRVILAPDTNSMYSAAQAIDREKTIIISGHDSELGKELDVLNISPYTDKVVKKWANDEDLIESRGHIPKALYRLMKLSELNESPNSINYQTLKI